MSELSTEVKAKETHEKAVGYFKVSEQYGYKFIMEVKNIRDDRYYKELGFSSFDDYCQNAWGFKRRWIDTKIQAASNLKESDFEHFNAHLGATKTFLLATMEDEQREGATSKGIPTDKGYKSIDEATQKEINEYKRNEKEAKERAEQAEKQAEQARQSEEIALKQLEELESKEPEVRVVEKEVIKEVDKTDYAKIQKLERQIEAMKLNGQDIEAKEKEVKLLHLEANKSVLSTKIRINELLKDVAFTSYRRGALAASSDATKRDLEEGLNDLENFIKEMRSALNDTITQ